MACVSRGVSANATKVDIGEDNVFFVIVNIKRNLKLLVVLQLIIVLTWCYMRRDLANELEFGQN